MRAPVLLPTLCLMAAAVAGCGSGATTNCRVPPDRPLLVAIRAHPQPTVVLPTSKRKGNAGRLTITACQTSDTEATATLTVFSQTHKSVRDVRHGMKLVRRSGKWTVIGDAHSRRCYEGHGSQEFSGAPCD
ncbi:MAG: hypothetical protein AVDCRST_MAG67-2569 [uncultured Solirubrobacteraceae bacterium]|uniref:Uncharacterized protein n=1 Tax=uncultured Solirubrobacteraceae bacterium TaxID=1162706 RepID=A0A6J4SYF5_9ACTN|nr:MAG: hypothetical protein AVDCRST_MAG67-2569 [uncultured Solirubrobacteraceae bacterium]